MSDNPFRELPEANPYAPPSSAVEAKNPLLIPGVFLLVLSSAFLFALIVLLLKPEVKARFR
jgi:hypothetical protein